MKILFAVLMSALLVVNVTVASNVVTNIDSQGAAVIQLRCSKCHTDERILAAAAAGKDLSVIVKRMEERGAVVSGTEKEVLGTFWTEKSPVKK